MCGAMINFLISFIFAESFNSNLRIILVLESFYSYWCKKSVIWPKKKLPHKCNTLWSAVLSFLWLYLSSVLPNHCKWYWLQTFVSSGWVRFSLQNLFPYISGPKNQKDSSPNSQFWGIVELFKIYSSPLS